MSKIDLSAIRARLGAAQGPEYWRGLEELAETPEFQEILEREFPQGATLGLDDVSRRRFLQLMGASLALAGVTGCTRQPREAIVPYVKQPEEIVPGKPLFFATAALLRGVATGVLVESHMGRPTKIEGNPDHPASLGGSDPFAQAWVLGLYDPDRSKVLTEAARIRPWSAFVETGRASVEAQRAKKGAGLRILTETVTSPTLARQLEAVLDDFPSAKWHQYEPAARDNALAGARLAFGEPVATRVDLSKADVIVTLDADFMLGQPGSLRLIRQFAARRRVKPGAAKMNRLYAVESSPTLTGARADHRLAVKPSDLGLLARALAARLGVGAAEKSEAAATHDKWLDAVAADLEKHRGASIVLAGDEQSPAVHALAHAMNRALGNVGRTVVYTEPVEARPVAATESLRDLVADLGAGTVDLLLVLGGNPVYDAPVDLDFKAAIQKAAMRVRLGLYDDETSELCHWQVPEAHALETWSDARAFDGTATILQPLIEPLYAGKSAHEVLSALFDAAPKSGHDIVRETWKGKASGDFESFWRKSLHDGVVAGTAFAAKDVQPRAELGAALPKPDDVKGLEIAFRTDPSVYDGRFSNNGWLQELPRPLTKLTWDNVAMVAPKTAEELALDNGQLVDLALDGRSVTAPVWIQPGHPQGSVTVHLGYGRTRAGRVGNGAGFNAYALRTSAAPWSAGGLDVKKGGAEKFRLAQTQTHHSMEGRELVRSASLAHYQKHPDFAKHLGEEEPAKDFSLYPEVKYEGYAWGMTIDLASCVGCNACTIACQAENNIAVVGKDQVARGREMHWIRVDRYFKGDDLDHPEAVVHQPVPCMQCENAPCEPVCPVGATNHSSEGLNDMVYNRCVGTRYCSNNCPYKVRRFNWYLYSDWNTESLKGLRNPNVTVRSRGVMEKCTYCVQRVNAAKIEAEKQDRRVHDGEIVTACQQACPAEAITFGDQNDAASRVATLKKDPRNYALLAELNTRPRTTYLAEVRNPNPVLQPDEPAGEEKAHHG